jgi:hypothetical protein
MDNKKKALDKAQSEIDKNIKMIEDLSKICGLGELVFFFHYLHFVRILHKSGNVPEKDKAMVQIYQLHIDDAYKYLIQCLFKNCIKDFIKLDGKLAINGEITKALTNSALHVNKLYESLTFFTLFPDLEVSGERNQNIKIDLEKVTKDDKRMKFMLYGTRVDIDNNSKKSNPKAKDDFFTHFRNEYSEYQDLFEIEFGISLERFLEVLKYLLEYIDNKIKEREADFITLPDGKIDIQDYRTIMLFTNCLFVPITDLNRKFGGDEAKLIETLSFKPEAFDIKQLRFNLLARQPLFRIKNHLLISPEILLDSMFINSHYSLLESVNVKEEYKKRYSDKFVSRLKEIASKYGYEEHSRELELYEGSNQIGDLDIVLWNKENDHYLLIEAKNHALPLDVYFHDFEATEKRLEYLINAWEKKVERRYKHIQKHHNNYSIGEYSDYIIVSRYPEILSHFSSFIVLNENEFELWIDKHFEIKNNNEILEKIYEFGKTNLSEEQLNIIGNDLMSGWRFEKE